MSHLKLATDEHKKRGKERLTNLVGVALEGDGERPPKTKVSDLEYSLFFVHKEVLRLQIPDK